MAKLSTDELLEAFKELSLIELSEFVKKFEETFEVTAAAPVAVALTSLGLGEAKALVDGAPATVLEGANKETAEKAKAQLEEAGATVVLK